MFHSTTHYLEHQIKLNYVNQNSFDYREKQSSSHDLLIGCHGPHFLQLLSRKLRSIRTTLQSWRVYNIQNQRNQHQRRQARDNCSFGPIQPPNRLVNGILRQRRAEWIRRHRRQKHRRRNHRSLKAREHEPRPQPVLRPVAGVAPACNAERLHEREEYPASPRRHRGNRRRQQRLAEDETVT